MQFHMAQDKIKLPAVVTMIKNIHISSEQEFSWLGEQMITSEEGLFLYCMALVTWR